LQAISEGGDVGLVALNRILGLGVILDAVREIDREGYIESMQNVPSWQRLAAALERFDAG
jgi:hypothetical protein